MNGRTDLSPEFLDHLRRNGLQAHVAFSGNGPLLVVRTQDSPYKTYPISQQQLSDLTGWGSNSVNKKAFTTLCDVIRKDFDVPQSMVAFTNANGYVNMGLHGYTVGRDEMRRGSVEVMSPSPGTLGRMAPNQAGYHLRRMPDTVIVPERADGSLKPGELLSGTYGFYYKGDQREMTTDQTRQMSGAIIDGLAGLDRAIAEQTVRDLGTGQPQEKETPVLRTFPPAERYSDLIYSDMAFSNEKWLECLSSHGIIIDTDKATLTVESSVAGQDRTYRLTDNEVHFLAQSDMSNCPTEKRLDMINAIMSPDFRQQVTMEALDSDRHIDLVPDAAQHEIRMSERQPVASRPLSGIGETSAVRISEGQVTDRQRSNMTADDRWRFSDREGQPVNVSAITIDAAPDRQYRITAVIDGTPVSHDITQRQYERLAVLEDSHRMRMIDRIFPELNMEKLDTRSRSELPVKLSAAIFAAVAVTADAVLGVHDVRPLPDRVPVMSASQPGFYFKPGVDSPADVAARQFEALRQASQNDDIHIHR